MLDALKPIVFSATASDVGFKLNGSLGLDTRRTVGAACVCSTNVSARSASQIIWSNFFLRGDEKFIFYAPSG